MIILNIFLIMNTLLNVLQLLSRVIFLVLTNTELKVCSVVYNGQIKSVRPFLLPLLG